MSSLTPVRSLRCLLVILAWVALRPAALAEMKAEPASLDLGRRRQEQTAAGTVKLTNAGTKPISILHVAADCSCTAGTPDKTELAPGESTNLEVTFQTRNYQGEVHRRVMIQTSEGDIAIPVVATVSAYDHWMLSGPMLILAPSTRGTPVTGNISINYVGAEGAEVKNVTADVPWLTAVVSEHSGTNYTLAVTTAPKAPAGSHQPKLTVHTTDKLEPELTIPMFAMIQSTLTIQPSPLLLPTVKVGTTSSLPVSMAGWTEKENPRFEVAEGKVTVRERDREDLLLTLEVTPSKQGTSTSLLRIYAGDSLEAEVPVIVRADD